MLQAIRDRMSGVVAIIVVGLLAIPFAFFGIQNYFLPDAGNAVAKVGDVEITATEYRNSFNNYRNRIRQMLGENFDEFAYGQPLIRRQHLDRMIDQELLQQYAVSGGMDISPESLAQAIREIPAFQVAGQFDETVYAQLLASQGLSKAGFEADMREDMATRNLTTALQSTAQPPASEINALLTLQNQTRGVDYVVFNGADYRDQVTVTDADIEAYYDDNAQQFMQPEKVSLAYIDLNGADITISEPPDELALKDRYDTQRQRFIDPERRKAAHILLNLPNDASEADIEASRTQAEALAARARDGEDFGALAAEFSDDPVSASNDGGLGWIEQGGIMPTAFDEALFAMQEQDVSEPVRTGFGWHVIKLDAIEPESGQSFADARAELEQEYTTEQAEREYLDMADRMVDLSFESPDTLEPVADDLDLAIQRTELFTRDGGSGIAAERQVIDAAFSDLLLLEQANSDPIQLGDNRMVIARVDEHIPATPRPLAEVDTEIREILTQQQASQMARNDAEALAAEALDSGSLAAVVADRGVADSAAADEAETSDAETSEAAAEDDQADAEAAGNQASALELVSAEAVSRSDFQLGQAFLQGVFAINLSDSQPSIAALPKNAQDWAVVQLQSVTDGDPETASEQERQRLAQQLQRNSSSEELEALLADLRTSIEVQVFEDRL